MPSPPYSRGMPRPIRPNSARPRRLSAIGADTLLSPGAGVPRRCTRRVSAPVRVGERLQLAAQGFVAESVGIVERSTQKRWKTDTQDSAQISVGWRPQDPFLEASQRLIHKQQRQPILDVVVAE